MEFLIKESKIEEFADEAMVLSHFEGEELSEVAQRIDEKIDGLIRQVLQFGDFKGKANEIAMIYTLGKIGAKRLFLVGLGKRSEVNREKVRGAYAEVAKRVRNADLKRFAVPLVGDDVPLELAAYVESLIEGIYLALYQFTPFKTVEREKIKEVDKVTLVFEERQRLPEIRQAVKTATTICHAVYFARDLVSTPANELTPSDLAQEARTIATTRKKITCEVLGPKEMKELGMNALLGVASGSHQPPKLIILSYRGNRKDKAPLVLVGKGLTFDSGGISIKPSEKMDEMKSDMAGGAAVMGAIMAVADMNLPVSVIGLIPATENLPGGRALKPGDILKSLSGQTIEVINTDAEGRLILADALSYAGRYKPAAIIDIATLTGACIIALGDEVIGLMGNNESLIGRIKKAAEITNEKVWELPLWEEYGEMIKSDVADYKNSAGRPAGTITAAAFLSKFVGDYPWAHLDIAGPAWREKEKAYLPKGASGVGVRLLVQFLRDWAREKETLEP